MVMPRSFSRSLESMTRSATASLARKVPDWRSMASTRVVLPWSTWAMMAMLRMGCDAVRCGAVLKGKSCRKKLNGNRFRRCQGVQVRVGAKRTQLIKFTADGAVYGFAGDRLSETSGKISVPSGGVAARMGADIALRFFEGLVRRSFYEAEARVCGRNDGRILYARRAGAERGV